MEIHKLFLLHQQTRRHTSRQFGRNNQAPLCRRRHRRSMVFGWEAHGIWGACCWSRLQLYYSRAIRHSTVRCTASLRWLRSSLMCGDGERMWRRFLAGAGKVRARRPGVVPKLFNRLRRVHVPALHACLNQQNGESRDLTCM